MSEKGYKFESVKDTLNSLRNKTKKSKTWEGV